MIIRKFYIGTVEYLTVTISATAALGNQAVALSIDAGTTWLTAAWIGPLAPERKAQVLLNALTMPSAPVTRSVYVRFVDSPEIPIFKAEGQVRFEAMV
jgi:hypothetical protein